MADGLSATAVWLKPIGAPDNVPVTIILDDRGKAASADQIADRLNRGEQVLALDLALMGGAWKGETLSELQQLIYSVGERPVGLEISELIEIAQLMKKRAHQTAVRLESSGIRSQVVALLASALDPTLFSELITRNGMQNLDYLLQKPFEYEGAPDLFCLDLLRETNLDQLAALSEPARVVNE